MAETLTSTLPLPNKPPTSIPRLGLGVYRILNQDCQRAALHALRSGYRHIDSAQLYRNEADVGAAIRRSSIARKDLFLTTKIFRGGGSPEKTYRSVLDSVRRISGEVDDGPDSYVDLFLIHNPGSGTEARERLWKALERLYEEGRAKAIGVSNFSIGHIEEMKQYGKVWPPHVNQIEPHPWCQQRELVKYCQEKDIVVEAYCPLVVGDKLKDPTLGAIASKHGKSPAQVLVRYSLQKNWVPLPKSTHNERIEENASVFDFVLDDGDMSTLDGLNQGKAGARYPANIRE